MLYFSQALFFIGVVTAVTSGAKVAPAPGSWPDTLIPFFAGASIALAGLVIWYFQKRNIAEIEKVGVTENGENPFHILAELIEPAQDLQGDISELSCTKICARVESLIDCFVAEFVSRRQRVIDALGMNHGSEILIIAARGERLLNRVWSAAADGHETEARSVYPEALQAFTHANELAIQHLAEKAS